MSLNTIFVSYLSQAVNRPRRGGRDEEPDSMSVHRPARYIINLGSFIRIFLHEFHSDIGQSFDRRRLRLTGGISHAML